MSDSQSRLCLIGLPSTGKTTYIAALWSYLSSAVGEGDPRVTQMPDDPRYLNEIASAWAQGGLMPRNSLGATDRIEFTVEMASGATTTLVLPDLPGESFRNAVIHPMIDEDTASAVESSDLLLFFVNGQTATTYTALGEYEVPPADMASTEQEFLIEALDSDTLNGELLHRLLYLVRDRSMPPLLVMVAAWDVHEQSGDTPAEWLACHQPMFAQMLEEIARTNPVEIVGVSAQGANYTDSPEIVEKLASERAWACDAQGRRTDIVSPLFWRGVLDR